MSAEQKIIAWAEAAQILIAAGVMTIQSLKGIWGPLGLSEAEQDEILNQVILNMSTRKRRSKAIAEGQG